MKTEPNSNSRRGCGCLSLTLVSLLSYGLFFYLVQTGTVVENTVVRLTATPINKESIVAYFRTPTPTDTATPTNTPLPPTPTRISTLPNPILPTRVPSATPTPTSTDTPTITPSPTPTSPADATATAISQATNTAPLPTAPIPGAVGIFTLLGPEHGVKFSPDPGPVSFKWQWGRGGCIEVPKGFGFELHIWPNRPDFGPMGVMDIVATQKEIGCDEKTGDRTLLVKDLTQVPGVAAVGGGSFVWDVAYVQLDPYTPIVVSEVRAFEFRPEVAPPPPTETPVLRTDGIGGVITYLALEDGYQVLQSQDKLQFDWQWGIDRSCRRPPAGYGFELRVWPEKIDQPPLGAMGDAIAAQATITCDPLNGTWSYLTFELKQILGIQRGLPEGIGRYRWDIVLVQFDPYQVIVQPESRAFDLPRTE